MKCCTHSLRALPQQAVTSSQIERVLKPWRVLALHQRWAELAPLFLGANNVLQQIQPNDHDLMSALDGHRVPHEIIPTTYIATLGLLFIIATLRLSDVSFNDRFRLDLALVNVFQQGRRFPLTHEQNLLKRCVFGHG